MKALGVFSIDRPSWAAFGSLADWCDFDAAAADSRATGVRWVLHILSPAYSTPLKDVLPGIVQRLDASGLRSFLVGVCYHEEWFSEFKAGRLTVPGFDCKNPAHLIPAAQMIRWWVSQQHEVLKAALPGVAVVWVDTFCNDDPSFGGWWYQPVPTGVDVLALEAYVPAGGSWAADVEPFLQHAVSTRKEPLALVVQGFQSDDQWWAHGPTDDGIAQTRRWLDHPRVIAGWVFTWSSRPGVRGLADLPQRGALEAALGVS